MIDKFSRELEDLHGLSTEHSKVLYYEFSRPYSATYKTYENSRLCTILEGSKNITVEDTNLTYNKNQFILLPPNSTVEMEIPSKTKAIVFEIDNTLIDKVSNLISESIDFDISHSSKNLILAKKEFNMSRILRNLNTAYFSEEKKHKSFAIDTYIKELLVHTLKVEGANQLLKADSSNPVKIVMDYMKANLHKKINIYNLSGSFNISRSEFYMQFKKITGILPDQFLKELRLYTATNLLGFYDEKEIAFRVGFDNIEIFRQEFRKKYGYTPLQYEMLFRQSKPIPKQ